MHLNHHHVKQAFIHSHKYSNIYFISTSVSFLNDLWLSWLDLNKSIFTSITSLYVMNRKLTGIPLNTIFVAYIKTKVINSHTLKKNLLKVPTDSKRTYKRHAKKAHIFSSYHHDYYFHSEMPTWLLAVNSVIWSDKYFKLFLLSFLKKSISDKWRPWACKPIAYIVNYFNGFIIFSLSSSLICTFFIIAITYHIFSFRQVSECVVRKCTSTISFITLLPH